MTCAGVDPRDKGVDQCSIYDLNNKFVAATNPFAGGVERVFYVWNSVIVLTADKRIYRLKEKGIGDKLEMLYRKNLYEVAAELAKTSGYDPNAIAEIFRRYGDHLYNKGEFDSAMTQYLKTIGHLEASYVIRRYVDAGGASRIDNLVRYLQKLHEPPAPTPPKDITTLLLNCYTQLEKLEQLDEFIKREGLQYDVETAINVCRQAGFYEQGLYLAEKHGQHSAWLRIKLDTHKTSRSTEDLAQAQTVNGADFEEALDYIKQLPTFDESKAAMLEYGRLLLAQLPNATTQYVIELCTAYVAPGSSKARQPDAHLEAYMDIFLGDNAQLMVFLETAMGYLKQSKAKVSRKTTKQVNETLLELYLQQLHEPGADRVSRL